ncbi:type VI secretion system tube protein Hcp [Thiotrichales bacterium 19S3-7]|nr:type VI secretion system tube protein Hcp [Thiotrichales bacterium 19S3-7]MCF6802144.1 type VI secretion system tube protein Hcp [Thiotrichales bacterium 19S3-11]
MANPIFLDIATQKGGQIKDPGQTKKNYKNQLLVQEFDQNISMSISHHKAHAGSVARPDPIRFTLAMGCYETELKQACATGDRITTATFSFPVTDKSGEEKNSYTIKATGGVITRVKRYSPQLWQSENDTIPTLVEVEIAYEKLEEQDLIHNKQMTYSWDER